MEVGRAKIVAVAELDDFFKKNLRQAVDLPYECRALRSRSFLGPGITRRKLGNKKLCSKNRTDSPSS